MKVKVDRAWKKLENLRYEWAEVPEAFTNKFICRHDMFLTRFPKEKIPRDKIIKRKLWHGLPKMSK